MAVAPSPEVDDSREGDAEHGILLRFSLRLVDGTATFLHCGSDHRRHRRRPAGAPRILVEAYGWM